MSSRYRVIRERPNRTDILFTGDKASAFEYFYTVIVGPSYRLSVGRMENSNFKRLSSSYTRRRRQNYYSPAWCSSTVSVG